MRRKRRAGVVPRRPDPKCPLCRGQGNYRAKEGPRRVREDGTVVQYDPPVVLCGCRATTPSPSVAAPIDQKSRAAGERDE
jgi:hypothetical protein